MAPFIQSCVGPWTNLYSLRALLPQLAWTIKSFPIGTHQTSLLQEILSLICEAVVCLTLSMAQPGITVQENSGRLCALSPPLLHPAPSLQRLPEPYTNVPSDGWWSSHCFFDTGSAFHCSHWTFNYMKFT